MSVVIRLLRMASGYRAPEAEGKYVQSFDPAFMNGRGRVHVVADPRKAQQFSSGAEAIAFWSRDSLQAWNVLVQTLEEALAESEVTRG